MGIQYSGQQTWTWNGPEVPGGAGMSSRRWRMPRSVYGHGSGGESSSDLPDKLNPPAYSQFHSRLSAYNCKLPTTV